MRFPEPEEAEIRDARSEPDVATSKPAPVSSSSFYLEKAEINQDCDLQRQQTDLSFKSLLPTFSHATELIQNNGLHDTEETHNAVESSRNDIEEAILHSGYDDGSGYDNSEVDDSAVDYVCVGDDDDGDDDDVEEDPLQRYDGGAGSDSDLTSNVSSRDNPGTSDSSQISGEEEEEEDEVCQDQSNAGDHSNRFKASEAFQTSNKPIRVFGRNCLGIVVAERQPDSDDTDTEPGF